MSNTQAKIMLKPNLCMQNSKIDPKMGKLIPTLETGNFSVLVCKIDNIFLVPILVPAEISAHIARVKIICNYMENFSLG